MNEYLQKPAALEYEPVPISLSSTPKQIFDLFFTQEILSTIAQHTNQYAAQHQDPSGPDQGTWREVDGREIKAFIAAETYMDVHKELDGIEGYWRTGRELGPTHLMITSWFSQDRFQQIQRFFHISPPGEVKENEFTMLEPLSSHLCQKSQQFWQPGPQPVVNEWVVRFTGRSNVDMAAQLHRYYKRQKPQSKDWKAVWHYLLNITVTNCFKLWRSHNEKRTRGKFRTELLGGLLACGIPRPEPLYA